MAQFLFIISCNITELIRKGTAHFPDGDHSADEFRKDLGPGKRLGYVDPGDKAVPDVPQFFAKNFVSDGFFQNFYGLKNINAGIQEEGEIFRDKGKVGCLNQGSDNGEL